MKSFHFVERLSGKTITGLAKVIKKERKTLHNWYNKDPVLLYLVCRGYFEARKDAGKGLKSWQAWMYKEPELMREWIERDIERIKERGRYGILSPEASKIIEEREEAELMRKLGLTDDQPSESKRRKRRVRNEWGVLEYPAGDTGYLKEK